MNGSTAEVLSAVCCLVAPTEAQQPGPQEPCVFAAIDPATGVRLGTLLRSLGSVDQLVLVTRLAQPVNQTEREIRRAPASIAPKVSDLVGRSWRSRHADSV